MTTMTVTLKEKVSALVGAVACDGSVSAWATEEIMELFGQQPVIDEGLCIVTQEDGNNYCRIISLLGMEEEGDPVAWVKAHLAKDAQDIVPTEMNWEEAYSLGQTIDYMHGWNDCRRVMLHALVPDEVQS